MIIIFVLLVSFYGTSLSETVILQGSPTQIGRLFNGALYAEGVYSIGSIINLNSYETYRTYFTFNLNSIPTNARIEQVSVSYGNTKALNYKFDLTRLESINPNDMRTNWEAIGNSDIVHSRDYMGGGFSSDPIKDLIKSSLLDRVLYIGAISEREDMSDSYSVMNLRLDVTYSVPATILNILVRNDLQGMECGNIGVGIYPTPASSRTSPATVLVYENNQLTLEAYDNQSEHGYNWIFNDTEGSSNKSSWEISTSVGREDWGRSQAFTSRRLLESDNNGEIIAYLKKHKITTSGTLTEGEYWFVNSIELTGDVYIPANMELRLGEGITVNLGNYSIISTGGVIINEGANIEGLAATVKSGASKIALCSSLGNAFGLVSSGQTIEIENGNYSGNYSLTDVNQVDILGNNGTLSGNITFNSTSYCTLNDFDLSNGDVNLNYTEYSSLTNIHFQNGGVLVNGGISPYISQVQSDYNNNFLQMENTTNAAIYGFKATNGTGNDYGFNIYNTSGTVGNGTTIENQMLGI